MKFINNFRKSAKTLPEIKQDESISTYFPRLSSDVHFWINWSWSCEDLVSFIRAFGEPYDGAKTRISSNHDEVLRIKMQMFIKRMAYSILSKMELSIEYMKKRFMLPLHLLL